MGRVEVQLSVAWDKRLDRALGVEEALSFRSQKGVAGQSLHPPVQVEHQDARRHQLLAVLAEVGSPHSYQARRFP